MDFGGLHITSLIPINSVHAVVSYPTERWKLLINFLFNTVCRPPLRRSRCSYWPFQYLYVYINYKIMDPKQKEYKRQYYLKNKDKFIEYQKVRVKTDKAKKTAKEYYEKNKLIIAERTKLYKSSNREKIKLQADSYKENKNKKWRERYKNDPIFRLKQLTQKAIYDAFKNNNTHKSQRTTEILGCSIEEFKLHIESQFEPWMSWNNQGGKSISSPNTNWDIDHIIPISSAKTEEEILKLNHYTNLQPLCSYTNRFVKRDNW